MRNLAKLFLALSLAAPAAAQFCGPAGMPIGQPALAGAMPMCVGALPLPLPSGGNPGFAISSFAPAVPPGSPTYLLISGFSPPPFVPLPAGVLCAAFGLPGTIPAPVGPFPLVAFAGPAGPGPGAPVSLPVPGGIAPGLLFLTVQTIAFVSSPRGLCAAVSNGTTITN